MGLVAEPQAPAPSRAAPLSKLALPSRAHLVLDIPKPLPDRPTLAAFSPVTKGRVRGETEPLGSSAVVGKAHSASERRACLGESATPKPRTEYQAHSGPNSPRAQQLPASILLRGPENSQSPTPEETPSPMEYTRPGAALSQDSGVHSSPVFMLTSSSLSVTVGHSLAPSYFCVSGLWYLSSCLLLSGSISHTLMVRHSCQPS